MAENTVATVLQSSNDIHRLLDPATLTAVVPNQGNQQLPEMNIDGLTGLFDASHLSNGSNTPSFGDVNSAQRHAPMESNGGMQPHVGNGDALLTSIPAESQVSSGIQQSLTTTLAPSEKPTQQQRPVKAPFSIDHILSVETSPNRNKVMNGNQPNSLTNGFLYNFQYLSPPQETASSPPQGIIEPSPLNLENKTEMKKEVLILTPEPSVSPEIVKKMSKRRDVVKKRAKGTEDIFGRMDDVINTVVQRSSSTSCKKRKHADESVDVPEFDPAMPILVPMINQNSSYSKKMFVTSPTLETKKPKSPKQTKTPVVIFAKEEYSSDKLESATQALSPMMTTTLDPVAIQNQFMANVVPQLQGPMAPEFVTQQVDSRPMTTNVTGVMPPAPQKLNTPVTESPVPQTQAAIGSPAGSPIHKTPVLTSDIPSFAPKMSPPPALETKVDPKSPATMALAEIVPGTIFTLEELTKLATQIRETSAMAAPVFLAPQLPSQVNGAVTSPGKRRLSTNKSGNVRSHKKKPVLIESTAPALSLALALLPPSSVSSSISSTSAPVSIPSTSAYQGTPKTNNLGSLSTGCNSFENYLSGEYIKIESTSKANSPSTSAYQGTPMISTLGSSSTGSNSSKTDYSREYIKTDSPPKANISSTSGYQVMPMMNNLRSSNTSSNIFDKDPSGEYILTESKPKTDSPSTSGYQGTPMTNNFGSSSIGSNSSKPDYSREYIKIENTPKANLPSTSGYQGTPMTNNLGYSSTGSNNLKTDYSREYILTGSQPKANIPSTSGYQTPLIKDNLGSSSIVSKNLQTNHSREYIKTRSTPKANNEDDVQIVAVVEKHASVKNSAPNQPARLSFEDYQLVRGEVIEHPLTLLNELIYGDLRHLKRIEKMQMYYTHMEPVMERKRREIRRRTGVLFTTSCRNWPPEIFHQLRREAAQAYDEANAPPKPPPPPPPPPPVEKKPFKPSPFTLDGFSTEAVFLALTQEVRGVYENSREGLRDMVRAKQEELDALAKAKEAMAPKEPETVVEPSIPVETTGVEQKEALTPVVKSLPVVELEKSPAQAEVIEQTPPVESIEDDEEMPPLEPIETVVSAPEPVVQPISVDIASNDLPKSSTAESVVAKSVNTVEVEGEEKDLLLSSPARVIKKPKRSSQGAKRKSRKKSSRKTKSTSDTDTESISEDTDEGYEDDAEYDLLCAIEEIDRVYDEADRKRKSRSSESSDDQGPSRGRGRPPKRKSEEASDGTPPKQRRSERLKHTTPRHDAFFFNTAMTAQSEQANMSESSRVENSSEKEVVKNKRKQKSDSGRTTPESGRSSITPPVEELQQHEMAGVKRPRAVRMDYSRRVSNPTIETLLGQILTPTVPEGMQILDYFKSPVIRRAIVNRNTLCYAISLVQLLLRVPQVFSIVRSHDHIDENTDKDDCFLCMLGGIISDRPSTDDNPKFVAILKSSWKNIEADAMHCVMEAMNHFFDRFDKEFMFDHPEYIGQSLNVCSPIRKFFYVESLNSYECTWCTHEHVVTDREIYVSVDLTKSSDRTMQGLINQNMVRHVVNGMKCPGCANVVSCTIRYTKLPEVLLYFIPRVRCRRKMKDMSVVYVQNSISMKDDFGIHKYSLCSFIVHCGNHGHKGHYKTFEVDRSKDIQYNEFDDARVYMNSRLCRDITVVLAMFRKEHSVAKDSPTDMIFDGRGNIVYADEKHCKQD